MTDTPEVTRLITLALARWQAIHGEVTPEDYHAIVAATRELVQ